MRNCIGCRWAQIGRQGGTANTFQARRCGAGHGRRARPPGPCGAPWRIPRHGCKPESGRVGANLATKVSPDDTAPVRDPGSARRGSPRRVAVVPRGQATREGSLDRRPVTRRAMEARDESGRRDTGAASRRPARTRPRSPGAARDRLSATRASCCTRNAARTDRRPGRMGSRYRQTTPGDSADRAGRGPVICDREPNLGCQGRATGASTGGPLSGPRRPVRARLGSPRPSPWACVEFETIPLPAEHEAKDRFRRRRAG